MGVRGLFSFLKQYGTKKTLDEILQEPQKKRIGIDISYYLYKWQGDIPKILEFIHKFISTGHKIILVFDGRAEDGKQAESKRRKDIRTEELKAAEIIKSVLMEPTSNLSDEQTQLLKTVQKEHEKRGWQLTREIRHAFKDILYTHKIPLLKAIGEADTLLTSLAMRKEIDFVISGDMDLLVLGTPLQYVPFEDGLQFYVFQRDVVLGSLKIYDDQFRSFCAICSTESKGASGSIPDIRTAYHGIRIFKNLENLKQKHSGWLEIWPTQDHIFFRDLHSIEKCLREDELPRYTAFLEDKPMPYYDKNEMILISNSETASYPSSVSFCEQGDDDDAVSS